MLCTRAKTANKIVKRRLSLRHSQRAVARVLGCTQSYIYQVEKASCSLSAEKAALLEKFFKVKAGSYTLKVKRGRPPQSVVHRRILKELQKYGGLPVAGELIETVPAYRRPQLGDPRKNPYWPMAIHLN